MHNIFMAQNAQDDIVISGNGYLYNGYLAKTHPTNLITDLSIPTESQRDTLISYVGGTLVGGGKLKEIGFSHWNPPNTGASNEYNFNAFGSGQRDQIESIFTRIRTHSFFWTLTTSAGNSIHIFELFTTNDDVVATTFGEAYSLPTRCMRELTAQEQIDFSDGEIVETKTDYDSNSYNVRRIGTQGWTDSNLKTTRYLTGVTIPLNPSSGFVSTPAMWAYNDNTDYV